MADFFHMGGFAFYIWSSFGLTLLLVIMEIFMLRQQRTSVMKRIRRIVAMQDKQNEVRS